MERYSTDELRNRLFPGSPSKQKTESKETTDESGPQTRTPIAIVPKPPASVALTDDGSEQQKVLVPDEVIPKKGGGQNPDSGEVEDKRDESNFHLDKVKNLPWELFPHQPVGGNSRLPLTIPNMNCLLKGYGIKVKYNLIKKEPEIMVPGLECSPDNAVHAKMMQIKSLAQQNGLSITGLEDMVLTIADREQYNPVGTWINSKSWDGQDRISAFCNTLTVREDCPKFLRDFLLRRWMISSVAAIFMPTNFRTRGVLTLQGPQSIGKTSWIGALIPDQALRESVIKLDHHLDAGNKDSQIAASTHWIVEIGELESSFKRDVARLKGFITNDYDKIRLPYARTASTFPRRSVFAATVNDSRFLVDSTGNTRWWVIPVVSIDYEHGLDMQQVWAQFAGEYKKGEQWWLTREEEDLLEFHNKDFRIVSAIEEQVLTVLDLKHRDEEGLPSMTPSELLKRLGFRTVSNPQAKECGAILREYLGEPKKINGYMKWRIPFSKGNDIVNINEY